MLRVALLRWLESHLAGKFYASAAEVGHRGTGIQMKRTFAAVILLAALGVFFKLAWKPGDAPVPTANSAATAAAHQDSRAGVAQSMDPEAALLARYTQERALVERVLENYHHNALAIERSDGLRGLVLLDRLGLEAVFLYEKYPREFRRLRDTLTDAAAADLLLHWREYFALKRADDLDRRILIAEVAALKPAQRAAASIYPHACPLILTEPVGMTRLIESWGDRPDRVARRAGAARLHQPRVRFGRPAGRPPHARRLRRAGARGLPASGARRFRPRQAVRSRAAKRSRTLALDDALILLRVNSDDVDRLLAMKSAEDVAGDLRHVASAGLIEEVGSSTPGLRAGRRVRPAGRAGPPASRARRRRRGVRAVCQ